ncbi:MAG: DUF5117 domain-containing protein, partial [Calditrichaeota bacterium]
SEAKVGRQVYGQEGSSEGSKKPKKKKSDDKPYNEVIKDMVEIEGLFTLYRDTVKNTMLMAVKPEQFGEIYLCNETRSKAEGAYFDNGAMSGSFPFYFKQVGKVIMMMEKNLRIRADESSPMAKAVEHGISDGLYASTDIKSAPHDSTGAILIDLADLFVNDAQNLSYFLGQAAKLGIRFDKKNSYFGEVKSFPLNTEIDVHLHYQSSRPLSGATVQNPYSMYHVYHYSLSTIKNSEGFTPRVADDRVGYFLSMYQDYTNLDEEDPYVRYINRWNLQKKDPSAAVSEPVEPVIYWIENTTPLEYRDAIARGIEFWNMSFEKIGFKNAIQAKIMPDTASWDPADVRYNTVRWIVIPGGGYAVGPSRANPFTGELYDADIRVSSDFLRFMFNTAEKFINPLNFDGSEIVKEDPLAEMKKHNHEYLCEYGSLSAQEAAFGLNYAITAVNTLVDKDSLTKEYIDSYLTELVAHEVGHTLGFRHNFKASTIYTLEQLQDREFTKKHGITGTVMDYGPPNLAPLGQPQGEFYMSVPGPYDDWVIEYGYTEIAENQNEREVLDAILAKSVEPGHVYSTDEDAFGSSPKSIDPYVNLFDLGSDPIAYCEHKITLTKELWANGVEKFETEGQNYNKLLQVFNYGWRSYIESARFAAKFVGGIEHNRDHVGDGDLPFDPVSAAEQKRAITFINDYIFAPDAFDLPANLWNKLQPTRYPDFAWSLYSTPQVDYPIHASALNIQNQVLSRLYSRYILGRLLNNQERVAPDEERYTMYDMFRDVRRSIWSEITKPSNVNSYRRQLQLSHLNRITSIYLSNTIAFPHDALTLAANDLDVLLAAAKNAVRSSAINDMTKAHYKEVIRQIEAAQGSKRNYSFIAR